MFSISHFYYIPFFALSPIRFCYMFYNFEVIILFFEHISPLHSYLFPISGVHPLTSGRRLTSGRLTSPHFPGCHPMPHIDIPPLHSSLSPISGVHPLTSGRRLTSGRLASPAFRGAIPCLECTSHLCILLFPLFPGCTAMPSQTISPLAFFSFPHFRGASLDFGAATHLGATCFPPLSRVSSHASHAHPTSGILLFFLFPGCTAMPSQTISPL